ncbi:topless-related protein 1 isoform X1 [Raphanus sativus]|uniref:Topless-related protein 1 isoform X1 n=2 Tax=Raphanus sativus TaxID=3726 RepID=A0A6J0MVA1_RAPSA|nr:topless-related protein 1 isoform X1 [Raphanus sativus]
MLLPLTSTGTSPTIFFALFHFCWSILFSAMATLEKELMFLILQYLGEEKYKETVHRLESESGCYFNMRYFEELVTQGEWDEMEKYLSGFSKIEDNQQSKQIFSEIRKQKDLEALDKTNAHLSTSARGALFRDLKNLIEANPLFRDKLDFPRLKSSMLRTLINRGCLADQSTPFAATENNELRTLPTWKSKRIYKFVGGGSKVTEITKPSQCYSLRLPDNVTDTKVKVSRLIYTNCGSQVLALASNGEHKLWKWENSDDSLDGKATAKAQPVLWTPKNGITMINELSDAYPEVAIPCLVLSKSDSYIVSASGGKISLFNMVTFKSVTTYIPPPPAATFLELHPSDNNIIGIALEDSSIQIYNLVTSEVKATLKGHRNRITGLAFSVALDILVSSCVDTQLCIWSMAGWEKRSSTYMDKPRGRLMPAVSDTRVQFHQNGIHMLVINEKQIAIYHAEKLDWFGWWVDKTGGGITSGAYSGDSQSIFASLKDGTVCVFTASNLSLLCRIKPTAYLPSNPSKSVYPLVIAAHPSEANQFAVGLSNGHVYVVEPSESEGRWGTLPTGST